MDKHRGSGRSNFNPRKPIKLDYERDEPEGWPLTRPATRIEWAHVIKAMIMRRVPVVGPIHRDKLNRYVTSDLQAASAARRLYVTSDFEEMRRVYILLGVMISRDKTLRIAGLIKDPEMHRAAPAVYRTDYAEGWLKRVPAIVSAVVDYLPVTDVLDLMVRALFDQEAVDSRDPLG
jgi:hypothetical protein